MTAYAHPAAALMRGDVTRLDDLATTPLRKLILTHMRELWLRPEQVLPKRFKILSLRAGRGWGKTFAIAHDINRAVEAGEARLVALVAPNEDRADEIQIKALIETSPPWFRPVRELGGLTWPNGVRAEVFTPERPETIRGDSTTHAWATELVAWPVGPDAESKRLRAFRNLLTATRRGDAKVYVDTTARGRNDVLALIKKLQAGAPDLFVSVHGHMADNLLFDRDYMRAQYLAYVEGSRRFAEEVEGADAEEVEGALWTQETLDRTRRLVAPEPLDLVILGMDPAYSDAPDADETGLVVAGRKGGHVYLTRDLSGRLAPAVWADLAVTTAIALRASGAVVEINSTASLVPTVLASACASHGLRLVEVPRNEAFPPWKPGVFHVKRIVSRSDKASRAQGPAAESLADRLHLVGHLEELEGEMTGYDPNTSAKSPGRLDAAVHAVNELAGLTTEAAEDLAPGVVGAAKATATMNQMLLMLGASRRVGL